MGVITAIRRNKKNTSRCSVFVDGEFLAACPIDVAASLGLKKGLELTQDLERRLRSEDRRMVLRQKLYRFATYKPRTERQVAKHLEKLEASPEEMESTLAWLSEFHLVDDARYAMNFIASSKERKPLSPSAVRRKLGAKGVDRDVIEAALDAAMDEADVVEAARKVAAKKRSALKGTASEQRDKLVRFLQYRGYAWDVIRTVVDEMMADVKDSVGSLVMFATLALTACAFLASSFQVKAQDCNKTRLPPALNAYQPTTQAVMGPDNKLYLDLKNHPNNGGGTADHDDVWRSSLTMGGDFGAPIRESFTTFAHPDVLFNFTHDGLHALIVGPYSGLSDTMKQSFAIASRSRTNETFHDLEAVRIPELTGLGDHFFGFLTSSMQVILIAVDPGAGTGMDLFVSTRCEDSWTPLRSLGQTINTMGFEGSPWLAEDMRTLYFVSNGRDDRIGQSDIYMSRRIGSGWTEWTTPVNLGRCVNTQEDETAISLHEQPSTYTTAFITSWDAVSARAGVYSIAVPRVVSPLPHCRYSQVTLDAVTGDTLKGAWVQVEDSVDQGACVVHRYTADGATGLVRATFTQNSRQRISTTVPGYVRHRQTIGVQNLDSTVDLHLTVQMFSSERPLVSLYFDRDSHAVSDSARQALRIMLQSYDLRDIRFEISGYTDAVGSVSHNATLSEARAAAVAEVLQDLGLPKERLVPRGRGVEEVGGVTTADENPSSRRVDVYAAEP